MSQTRRNSASAAQSKKGEGRIASTHRLLASIQLSLARTIHTYRLLSFPTLSFPLSSIVYRPPYLENPDVPISPASSTYNCQWEENPDREEQLAPLILRPFLASTEHSC
jgi:hypothetical protein